MTALVFAWPPVGVIGAEWTEEAPVQMSRSLITGAERLSAYGRARRLARLQVSALSGQRMGAGYMEMLKRHLAGLHCVRLYSTPINRHFHAAGDQQFRQSQHLDWQAQSDPLDWQRQGQPLVWFTGTVLTGTAGTGEDGWPILTVSGLPPERLVARPGEFVTAYQDTEDRIGETAQVTAPARSDASGTAIIRLVKALPGGPGVRLNIGGSDTGVFRPVNAPRAVQPVRGDWTYDWQFREVFADEVGGFEEVDPWR